MRKRQGGNQPCSCKRLGQPAMLAFSFAVCSCALQQWSGDLLSPLLMVKLIGHSTFPAFSVCLFFTRKAHNAATKGRVCLWSAYHTWVGLDIDWIARKEKSEFVFWLFRQLSLAFIPTSKLGFFGIHPKLLSAQSNWASISATNSPRIKIWHFLNSTCGPYHPSSLLLLTSDRRLAGFSRRHMVPSCYVGWALQAPDQKDSKEAGMCRQRWPDASLEWISITHFTWMWNFKHWLT